MPRRSSRGRDWYSVSTDTLRALGMTALVLVALGLGYAAYEIVRPHWQGREATRVIEEARILFSRLQGEESLQTFAEEFETARKSLQQAQAYLREGAVAEALRSARLSRALLTSILDAQLHRRPTGDARFISVQGGVEFRRGERGEWRQATSRDTLHSGDYVKTAGDGSAELMFLDGTLYSVRPNTLFVVARPRALPGLPGEQAIAMEYGWVDLNTSQRASRVSTPGAEARIARQSEGLVAYEQASRSGRFAAYSGAMEVVAQAGGSRTVGAREEVFLQGGSLSRPLVLPSRPELVEPEDNLELDLRSTAKLLLSWKSVPGAARYALQVSRSRLFVDNIVNVEDRAGTRATLGLRGEGAFVWRVAAVSAEGARGQWSLPGRFRVVLGPASGS